jgi:hypothetical protein
MGHLIQQVNLFQLLSFSIFLHHAQAHNNLHHVHWLVHQVDQAVMLVYYTRDLARQQQ